MERSPRVLAVLVAHDGAAWLPAALDAIAAQTYPHLDLVAVDNGSTDGTLDLLTDRLGEDAVLVADRDLGFGGAVAMALDGSLAAESGADHLLLVHDDLTLEPDAVERLVEHLSSDPRVAAVGPKLVDADDPRLLQQVGMSIDITGRADSGLEPDELDQGQRDREQPVLYVSTAGMLVRRDLFEQFGGFDRRYHVFRDDLDLCWRLWIAGHDVEVAPAAVGSHVRAVSNYARLGQTIHLGPRYFAERNTLATLLKCYGAARLLWVVPLFLLVGLAKIAGFVATRRFSDAWQTVRAWAWNVLHLRQTLRLRRPVQASRLRTDGEIRQLFTRIVPRVRAYGEAIADRLAGGDGEVPVPAGALEPGVEDSGGAGRFRFLVLHPVVVTAGVLGIIGLIGALPLLGGGPLRGGSFAPWPAEAATFFDHYLSGWHDAGGLGSAEPPSPAQAVLGLLHVVTLGNEWLAERLVVLGTLPVAWLSAFLAGRLLTRGAVPRVFGATVYALSPPVLAAVLTGRLGAMVTAALLPGLVVTAIRLADVRLRASSAWRAAAIAAILAAVVVAFEPPTAPVVLLAAAVGLVAVAGVDAPPAARRGAGARILAATGGALVLLLPWSLALFAPDSPVIGGYQAGEPLAAPFLRWLVLAPGLPGAPGPLASLVFPAAGLLALLVGFRRRPTPVGVLLAVVLVATLGAWALGRTGPQPTAWPGLPLLASALGYALLLTTALATSRVELRARTFGWAHVSAGVTVVAVVVGLGAATIHLAAGGWDAYDVNEPALPAFIGAEEESVGPYRVVILAAEDGAVRWDVTGSAGPTMLDYGAPVSDELVDVIDQAIEDTLAGVSPAAASRLGLANVRYVYVPEGGREATLEASLAEQFDLEPQAVEQGTLYLVRGWLPRVAYLPPSAGNVVARRAELPPDVEPVAFEQVEDDTYTGDAPAGGSILVAEPPHPGWEARVGGRVLEPVVENGLMRFTVPSASEQVTVAFEQRGRRNLAVGLQVFVALLAASLVLRPPGFATEAARR